MIITVVGAGYVGLSTAVLLSEKHDVFIYDISERVVSALIRRECPIDEPAISDYLHDKATTFKATNDIDLAYFNSDAVIIAVPTDYDEKLRKFNMSILDHAVDEAIKRSSGPVIIKSTVPIGYTAGLLKKYETDRIIFAPEFLREGKALYDVSHPSRIIIGAKGGEENPYSGIAADIFMSIGKNKPKVLFMEPSDAEAVKLFANTYLAMRVAYFNELDTFAECNSLDTGSIIKGVCLDPRIGEGYANPSFGFGGYCLPKDSKELAALMNDIPGCLIKAIPESNDIRIKHIAKVAAEKTDGVIGIYGLAMKNGSKDSRASSSLKVAEELKKMGRSVITYDDDIRLDEFPAAETKEELREKSGIILMNRAADMEGNTYTRDVFGDN